MPNINLIAARRVEKRRMERLSRQVFFGMAASVGVLVMTGSVLVVQRIELASQLASADQKMTKLKPKLAEIARIRQETDERRPKVERLEEARNTTLRWCVLLNVLSRSLPAKTWIEQFESNGKGSPTVNLKVVTDSQTTAGQTASLLQSQPIFEDINIPGTQTTAEGTVRFDVIARMKPFQLPGMSATTPTPTPSGQAAQAEVKGGKPDA
jgi:Tfp pilus assembly protein PilN